MYLRKRPFNKSEKGEPIRKQPSCRVDGKVVALRDDKHGDQNFRFDEIYDEDVETEDLFIACKNFVEDALKGFNCTLFAYGATGSGKTFTVHGDGPGKPGLSQLSFKHLYSLI